MTLILIIPLALGLAMDAFAVSLANGMCLRMNPMKNALSSGIAFGLSQGAMPLIGYAAGHTFSDVIEAIDHWIALILLCVIGGRMIAESIKERGQPDCPVRRKPFSHKTLALQAVATSIDALAVGVGLGVMRADIVTAACAISLITFACSFCGVLIGNRFGGKLRDKAEILGGIILILLGIHIFGEHVGILFH